MSQCLGIYNILLLPCGKSRLLQRRGTAFACRLSNLGLIPGWGRLTFFTLRQSDDITRSFAELRFDCYYCQK